MAAREVLRVFLATLVNFGFAIHHIFGNEKYLQICNWREVHDGVFVCHAEVCMTLKLKMKNFDK